MAHTDLKHTHTLSLVESLAMGGGAGDDAGRGGLHGND